MGQNPHQPKRPENKAPKADLKPMEKLLWVMTRLRDKDAGCPWDLEQDFKSIVPYTIEEAYEVADAIDRNDIKNLKEELGDLLLQVVYHAQMARELNQFDFNAVADAVADKMISRHPHVFGNQNAQNADEVIGIWDAQKDAEKDTEKDTKSALDGITKGLPALLRAQKLQKKAARVGYVWPDTDSAFEKLEEEILEFKEAQSPEHQSEELGDLLFCLVNFARMKGLDSEESLRQANQKFEKRFRGMESDLIADGFNDLKAVNLETWLDYWRKQKRK